MTTAGKRQPAFTDTDPMPFGKYKGEPLQDVPASYLRWLWNELKADNFHKASVGPVLPDHISVKVKLANYIHNSRAAIEQELGETL